MQPGPCPRRRLIIAHEEHVANRPHVGAGTKRARRDDRSSRRRFWNYHDEVAVTRKDKRR